MTTRSPGWLGASLGLAQLVAWGALYYPPTVLASAVEADTGLPSATIYGGLTYALVVAAIVSPWVARAMAARGARAVVVFGTALGSAGLVALAASHGPVLATVGATAVGAAMGLSLYDAVFAALASLELSTFRKTLTGIVLVGGFASTASWPLVAALEARLGWRGALFVLAALLAATVPLYAPLLPRHRGVSAQARDVPSAPLDRRALLLVAAFACASFVTSAIGAHVVDLLALGVPRDRAIAIASALGPIQVAGRVVDRVTHGRVSARSAALFTFAGLAITPIVLAGVGHAASAPIAFAVVFGAANGALTIARAGVPAELEAGSGPRAVLLGRLATASLTARAAAPLTFAALAGLARASTVAIAVTFAVALIALASYVAALRTAPLAMHSTDGGTR